MKTFFPGPLTDHSRNIMRSLGYGEQRTRQGQISYIKRLGGDRFPHFHAYVEDREGGMQVNLHIDQKEASYGSGSMHAGEYEGAVVEGEMRRIGVYIQSLKTSHLAQTQTSPPTAKKGFISKFFG